MYQMELLRRNTWALFIGAIFLFLFTDVSQATRVSRSANIVNGTAVQLGQYPFMVSLEYNGSHNCGGSIINKFYILTAAHCLKKHLFPSRYSVLVGTVKLSKGGTRYPVSSIKIHENYFLDNVTNDIGIVKLKEPLTFNENVKPVALPAQNTKTPSSTRVDVIGWGLEDYYGSITDRLMKVQLIVYSDEACLALHADAPGLPLLPTPKNICAGLPEGGKAECKGDSGGPLFTKTNLVGIVSWSVKPCGIFPYPGVFTEVSQYINWIKKNTPMV